jgi:hypothetical protein
MIINFFDHFLALKSLVEDKGKIEVIYSNENSIAFNIEFSDSSSTETALNYIVSNPRILIYGRFISVRVNLLTDKKIEVILQ